MQVVALLHDVYQLAFRFWLIHIIGKITVDQFKRAQQNVDHKLFIQVSQNKIKSKA